MQKCAKYVWCEKTTTELFPTIQRLSAYITVHAVRTICFQVFKILTQGLFVPFINEITWQNDSEYSKVASMLPLSYHGSAFSCIIYHGYPL